MSDTFIGVTQPGAAAKGWVAVAGGVVATLITVLQTVTPFLPQNWTPVVVGVVALLTSVSVYFVPNAKPAAPGEYRNPWRKP